VSIHQTEAASAQLISELAARLFAERLDIGETLQAVAEAARRALGADRVTCYAGYQTGG
jgi:hypothetical protein